MYNIVQYVRNDIEFLKKVQNKYLLKVDFFNLKGK